VAARARVDISTVSRALNPEARHLISDEVVVRVIEATKALGYRKNKVASALTRGRSQVIGIILPDIENSLFPPMVRGIEERLAVKGYAVLIANAAGAAADRERVLEQMFERQVDGVVVATANRDDQMVRRCILEHIPVVLVNRSEEHRQVAEVVNDDFHSMQLAMDHLVGLGHRKIAHVAGPLRLSTGFARWQGFQMAAQRCLGAALPARCLGRGPQRHPTGGHDQSSVDHTSHPAPRDGTAGCPTPVGAIGFAGGHARPRDPFAGAHDSQLDRTAAFGLSAVLSPIPIADTWLSWGKPAPPACRAHRSCYLHGLTGTVLSE
jgi:hypothetical protein